MHELIEFSGAERQGPARTWRAFCGAVGELVDALPVEELPARIAAILPDLLSVGGLLTTAQRTAPKDGYGRNRVFVCPGDRFSVLAMVWPAGVSTLIHDHRDWCALGVYSGEIEESRFDPCGEAKAVLRDTVRHRTGAVAHLPVDAPNIHRIRNPTSRPAISIHVYGGNCETQGPNLDTVYTLDP